jgi:hypothetical protein
MGKWDGIDDLRQRKILNYLDGVDVGIPKNEYEIEEIEEEESEVWKDIKMGVKYRDKGIDPNTPFFFYSGADDEKTRPFCRYLLRLNKLFRLEDITRLSKKVGYDVELYFGGFNCRHKWKRARIKGQLQQGLVPDSPSRGNIDKAAVQQSDTMQNYFPL